MNLKRLKREFGEGVEVTRDRKLRVTNVRAAGLGYQVEETFFENERELAEHMRSKVPALSVGPRQATKRHEKTQKD